MFTHLADKVSCEPETAFLLSDKNISSAMVLHVLKSPKQNSLVTSIFGLLLLLQTLIVKVVLRNTVITKGLLIYL